MNMIKVIYLSVIGSLAGMLMGTTAMAQANMSSPQVMGSYTGCNDTYTDTRSNAPSSGYGNDMGQPSDDIYYRFTLTGNANVTISTCGSGFDTYLHLLDVNGTEITYNDDDNEHHCSSSGLESYIQRPLNAGTYYIVAEGYAANSGNITMSFNATGGACPTGLSQQNYVRTFTPNIPIADRSALQSLAGDKTQVRTETAYFDGLGRPMQMVQRQGSPQGKDLVVPVSYDAYGREVRKYLPYASIASDGEYKPNALTSGVEQSAFYNPTGSSGTQLAGGIPRITTPYAETVFEPSPLNRPLQQGAPGDAWQPGNGHVVGMAYETNGSGEVKLWQVNAGANGASWSTNYAQGELFRNKVTDENGHYTIEYKDKEGHVVCKKVQAPGGNDLATYYVYDDHNNLAYVIPPLPQEVSYPTSFSESDQVFTDLLYGYHYDHRDRVIEKKIPGKGWEFMVYNKLDQVTFTQDANQRNKSNQEWTYTRYDIQGRVVITGIYYSGDGADGNISSPSRSRRLWLANWSNDHAPVWATYTGTGDTGYNNDDPPGPILSINYYDNYTFPGAGYYPPTSSDISSRTKGLLTGTSTAVLNPDGSYSSERLLTVIYYDSFGRPVQNFAQHYAGGITQNSYDETASTYYFTGEAHTVTRHHYKQGAIMATVANTYDHDHMRRKTQTWQSTALGTNPLPAPIILSRLEYNEVGQLWKKRLHSANGGVASGADHVMLGAADAVTSGSRTVTAARSITLKPGFYVAPGSTFSATIAGSGFLQDITYAYNERGWLTASHSPFFVLDLRYDKPSRGALQQWNGNISEQEYTKKESKNQWVTYSYDELNRLTAGNSSDGISENGITYDNLGNIRTLSRGNQSYNALTYTYKNGNKSDQLSSVSGPGFPTRTYDYDLNGNATTDGLATGGVPNTIYYNMLNLPRSVPSKNLSYTYSAGGQKLAKKVGSNTTYYISGIQYTNGNIDFIQTEEGRALPTGNTFNYEYTLSDHLGNNRVTFDQYHSQPVGETDYYPFGLNANRLMPSNANMYRFNSKEQQEELNDQYDYGARFYDPVIARWTSVDPLAELSKRWSSYNFSYNNALRFIDPDGMHPLDGGNGTFTRKDGSVETYDLNTFKTISVTPPPDSESSTSEGSDLGGEQSNGEKSISSSSGSSAVSGDDKKPKPKNANQGRHTTSSLNLGFGFTFSGGIAISNWGRTVSIGFFGAPHTMGQLFLSIGRPTGLEVGVSIQALVGNTKQKHWDISGSGVGGGFGFADVSGSYSTTSNNAYHIVGLGPALSLKTSLPIGGSVAPSTTYTLPMMWPTLLNAVGGKF